MKNLISTFVMVSVICSSFAQAPTFFSVLFSSNSAKLDEYATVQLQRDLAERDLSKIRIELRAPLAVGPDEQLATPRVEAVKAKLIEYGVTADSVHIIPVDKRRLFWRDIQGGLDCRVLITLRIQRNYETMKDWVVKEPQLFTANACSGFTIRGKEGCMLRFEPNSLVDAEGKLVSCGDVLRVELIEFLTVSDMLQNRLSTKCGDRILETAGMIHVSIWRGEDMLYLAPGKEYVVSVPERKSMRDMQGFTGAKANGINWEETGSPWIANQTEDVKAIKYESEEGDYEDPEYQYYGLKMNQLNWINCDRFYDAPVLVDFAIKPSQTEGVRLYAILTSSRSVLEGDPTGQFAKMPPGEKLTIVATSSSKDKLFFGKSSVIVGKTKNPVISIAEVSKDQLDKEMAMLDKAMP